MTASKTNKLSIMLIKKEYKSFESIIPDSPEVKTCEIDSKNKFYYSKVPPHIPSWINNFFDDKLENLSDIKVASVKGVLLTKINIKSNSFRIFAVTFGHGRFLLDTSRIEDRFGLKTVLNLIKPDAIRVINKKDISNVPKHSIEQRSKVGNRFDFGINIEQELLQGITGKVKLNSEKEFGKTISGSDSLSLLAKINFGGLNIFLRSCYYKYVSGTYKADFDWIDQITPVKKPDQINRLNDALIRRIKDNQFGENIWLAVPEIVEWQLIKNFVYDNKPSAEYDDIFMENFVETLSSEELSDINIDFLKKIKINANNPDGDSIYSWSIYDCLYGELTLYGKTYLLSNKEWFQIEDQFVKKINSFYDETIAESPSLSFTFPNYDDSNEAEFNKSVSKITGLILMDKKNVHYGGRHSQIEFCDLISASNEIFHIKKSGGSNVLGHLFNQGLVSGELMKADPEFIRLVNEKIGGGYSLPESIDTRNFKIIFGILTKIQSNITLPFFSKIALKNVFSRLRALGYQAYLMKISTAT